MMATGRGSRGRPPIMKVTDLPLELIDLVMDELPRSDIKSLRCAHSKFANSTERRLFATVVISKTKRDLASLLGIAGTPRLAVIPTRLVWYELMEDQNNRLRSFPALRSLTPSNFDDMMSMLCHLAADAFWTEPYIADGRLLSNEVLYLARREKNQATTEQAIGEAVRKLVNLHTLVAQPMPPDRLLAVSDTGYELSSTILQTVTHLDANVPPPNGLFLFNRACLGETLTRQIRALHLAGPFTTPEVFAKYYAASDDSRALFESLSTIDLCMHGLSRKAFSGNGEKHEPPDRSALPTAQCLRLATKLQRLSICFETLVPKNANIQEFLKTVLFAETEYIHESNNDEQNESGKDERDGKDEQYKQREENKQDNQPFWPLLHSLQLTDAAYLESDLVHFLALHSSTLKHLGLLDCVGHTKRLVTAMAAMRHLQLSSFRVRSYLPDSQAHGSGRDDYLVPEQPLLTFVNKQTTANPLSNTAREVFSTGPYIWEPQDWPAAAYLDLVCCTSRLGFRSGILDGGENERIGLQGEDSIDLGHQEQLQTFKDNVQRALGVHGLPDGNAWNSLGHDNGPYHEINPPSEISDQGMPDIDQAWAGRRDLDTERLPYSSEDTAWIEAWAAQTTEDENVDLDEVSALPLVDKPRSKTSYQQTLLLAEREADIRHTERCRGNDMKSSPRWCWMRGHIQQPGSDTTKPEIYYWKTTMPGQGHPTTNWTFYQEYEDGTAAHGFGAEPLDFFTDWDSINGSEDDADKSVSEGGVSAANANNNALDDGELSDGEPPPPRGWRPLSAVRMYAEPSVYSRAFQAFLEDAFDPGDPLEAGVDIIKLERSDVKRSDAVNRRFAAAEEAAEAAANRDGRCIVKRMALAGLTASPLIVRVAMPA